MERRRKVARAVKHAVGHGLLDGVYRCHYATRDLIVRRVTAPVALEIGRRAPHGADALRRIDAPTARHAVEAARQVVWNGMLEERDDTE